MTAVLAYLVMAYMVLCILFDVAVLIVAIRGDAHEKT